MIYISYLVSQFLSDIKVHYCEQLEQRYWKIIMHLKLYLSAMTIYDYTQKSTFQIQIQYSKIPQELKEEHTCTDASIPHRDAHTGCLAY